MQSLNYSISNRQEDTLEHLPEKKEETVAKNKCTFHNALGVVLVALEVKTATKTCRISNKHL